MNNRNQFPASVIEAAWRRSGGFCECNRPTHNHPNGKCPQKLSYSLRGSELLGGWEAHHINSNGEGVLNNCEILCQPCHKKTQTYGG